jgi:mono/diheme cytochrome c family protein
MLILDAWRRLAIIVTATVVLTPYLTFANADRDNTTRISEASRHTDRVPQSPGNTVVAENKSDGAVTQEARSQASDIFENRCSACHGMEGRGDGPAAASLKPKPADFHSPKWQKAITDDRIARAIVHGGGSVGVSKQMAPNPDLEDQPAVVAALVERIRKWGK